MNKVDNTRFLSNFGKTREERKIKRKKMKMIHQIEKASEHSLSLRKKKIHEYCRF